MQVARSLARSTPRAFLRSTRLPCRISAAQPATRCWAPTMNIASKAIAKFSTSRPQFQVNEELAAKLRTEITYEQELQAEQSENTTIKDYLSASEYQLEDVDGSEEVHLVRTYGDEQIKVTFSTDSFSNPDAEVDSASDPALYDESSGQDANKIRQAPEDEIESDEYDEAPANYQVHVSIQVSRQGKGVMTLAAFLDQDARFNVEHVAHFPTVEMAEGKTAEHELSKRNVYTGPPFEELDEGLQTLFDEYLRERGIDESMGVFIPSYIEQKESQEYMRWMQNISKFVE